MTVTELLAATKGKSFSIDTRTLMPGDVYIALRGEAQDGHQFVAQAKERGASSAIVDHAVDVDIPQLIVENTEHALQQLAKQHREQLHPKVIAVTGSCGKTTTRAFLQNVFAEAGVTHASVGSFNNHIGVPLTLLKLEPTHQFLVSEVGANHVGEIANLIPLVQPDVAIITNVGPAHLEGFGSLDNVAKAKAEIYGGLAADGVAVINNDDAFADYWQTINKDRRVVTFGVNTMADVIADNIQFDERGLASFTLMLPDCDSEEVQLAVIGEHNVSNALAAAAAGYALGLTSAQIKQGLEKAQAVYGRLVEKQLPSGAVVIDDSYNANPLSTSAAIKALAKRAGERILVLGDMRELGPDGAQLHAQIGELANSLGIDAVFCYGDLTRHTVRAFGERGFYFADKAKLIEALKLALKSQQTVLVKGSHSMKMNEVVEALEK